MRYLQVGVSRPLSAGGVAKKPPSCSWTLAVHPAVVVFRELSARGILPNEQVLLRVPLAPSFAALTIDQKLSVLILNVRPRGVVVLADS